MTMPSPDGPAAPKPPLPREAISIAGAYAVAASLWILFSDTALELFISDPRVLARISLAKGLIFVAVTSVLLLLVIRRILIARDAAQAAMEKNSRRVQSIFDQAVDGIMLADAAGVIREANRAIMDMGGYQADQVIGRPFSDFLGPAELSRLGEAIAAVLAGQTLRSEWEIRRADGSFYPGDTTAKLLPGDFILVVVRDISRHRDHEQALTRSLAEKEAMLRELHHRVKNNLQIIISLINLERGQLTDQAVVKAFEATSDRIRSMAMVHEKLYAGENLAAVDMDGYCRTLLAALAASRGRPGITHEAKAKGVYLPVDQAIPCGLILNELCVNAMRHAFTAGNGGHIGVSLAGEGDEIVLLVSDDGQGFDPGIAAKGETLGFSLVKILAGQLGGGLSLDSGPSGTRVRVRFPRSSKP